MNKLSFFIIIAIVNLSGCSITQEPNDPPLQSPAPSISSEVVNTIETTSSPTVKPVETPVKEKEINKITIEEAIQLVKSKLDAEAIRVSNIREDGVDKEGKYVIRQSSQATTTVIEWYHVDPVSKSISCQILKDSCLTENTHLSISEINKNFNKEQSKALELASDFAQKNLTDLGYMKDLTYIELRNEAERVYTFQVYNPGSGQTETIDWLTVDLEKNAVSAMFNKEPNNKK